MDDKELQEFTLEDIIKEFGEGIIEEPPAEEAEAAPEEPVKATVTDATIRLDKIPDTKGAVRNAQQIDDEEEEEAVQTYQPEEKAEPYSEQWEPEYEQPIAEYVPQRPILFHPRSQFRDLKRKLVAGPEKQYYALTEKGLGKLQAAIFFSVLVVLVSAAATVMFAMGLVPESRLKLMVFGQFLAMLLSALIGCYQLLEGAADLWHKRFSLNSLLLFTFVLCCVDGIVCLRQLRVPCCAAFSLQVTMSLWAAYQKRNTKLGQLDTLRKATHLDCVGVEPDYCDGLKGIVRGEGQVEHFMDNYEAPSRLEKILSVYALVALCVSVAVGVAAGILHGYATGIQVAAVTTLAAMPASMFVILSRPMAVLERRMHKLGSVLCGWQGVDALSGKALFPVDHHDLFPVSAVKMNGVKFFGSRQPDDIIAYATALTEADGGSLAPLFAHLLDSRNGMHYTVENFRYYPEGGVGGDVNGESTLAGTFSFLKEMGVEVPEGIRVSQAVCVAIDGELCGLFAFTYEKDPDSAAGLNTLCAYRGLRPVVVTDDFMINPGFIRNRFGINPKKILVPEHELRRQLREVELQPETVAAALVTKEGLAPFAYAVTGARALNNAVKSGIVVHMVGGILGILMMLVLAFLGATEYLTPASMFLYELVWMVPGLLITEWTRSI